MRYLINPVESRLASLEKPKTLDMEIPVPENVKRVEGFNSWNDDEMQKYYDSMGFAMTLADLKFCRDYFRDTEHRDPSVTELRVIDTYWSDHCRHTTFLTRLEEIEIESRLSARLSRTHSASIMQPVTRFTARIQRESFHLWIWLSSV